MTLSSVMHGTGNMVKNITIEASLHWNDTSMEMIHPSLCRIQRAPIPGFEMPTLPCAIPVMGRYLRITKHRDRLRRFIMCEVEVYGKSTGACG